jgi:hypothetical protein
VKILWLIPVLLFAPFASTQNYKPNDGYVPNAETAVKIAEAVLIPVYGERQIISERPFRAVLKDNIWTVDGTLHCRDASGKDAQNCFGGAAQLQISKQDGRIIRMIHYK